MAVGEGRVAGADVRMVAQWVWQKSSQPRQWKPSGTTAAIGCRESRRRSNPAMLAHRANAENGHLKLAGVQAVGRVAVAQTLNKPIVVE